MRPNSLFLVLAALMASPLRSTDAKPKNQSRQQNVSVEAVICRACVRTFHFDSPVVRATVESSDKADVRVIDMQDVSVLGLSVGETNVTVTLADRTHRAVHVRINDPDGAWTKVNNLLNLYGRRPGIVIRGHAQFIEVDLTKASVEDAAFTRAALCDDQAFQDLQAGLPMKYKVRCTPALSPQDGGLVPPQPDGG